MTEKRVFAMMTGVLNIKETKLMINVGNMLKITNAWNIFKKNHPKFPAFCKAVSKKGIQENCVIEIAVITPEGERLETNLKVRQSDLELLEQLKDMA